MLRNNQILYVNLFRFLKLRCYSYLGFVDIGSQPLNLASDCNGIEVTIHEWLHALGFYHEHTRADRDDHITVNFTNVMPGKPFFLL